jgi:mono/diheme cytochrome c family protein
MTMRHFLACYALLLLAVIGIAGFRGGLSRRPPIELFADMSRQPKVRPQLHNDFFRDTLGSRLPVAGTVARGSAYEDLPANTGLVTGATNFVELNPLPITAALLARGQERFQINCQPCHGPQADGKGINTKYGMVVIANLHDPRIVRMPDGEIFNTISNGKNQMQAYGSTVVPRDRWAIIAYLRALQFSHLATIEDVPADQRAALKK